MPRLKDYEILAPFSADELIQNANALLRHIPEAQLQKRTLRFYSSQGLLPPPEGPRSKAQYRYEHLVILVALRLFKHLGLKLELIEEVIRKQQAEGIEKLAQTVQRYLDQVRDAESSLGAVSKEFDRVGEHLLEDDLDILAPALYETPMLYLSASRLYERPSRRTQQHPSPVRLQLTPQVTLEVSPDQPLHQTLKEAYLQLKRLLKLRT